MDFNTFDQEQILSLLDIQNDGSIVIEGIEVIDNIKFVHISKKLEPVYCPKCMCRMHSKGIYTRKVNHHIMQDTMKLFLLVKQRKWYCKHCGLYLNDQFAFLERYSHSSNIVHLLILEMMKDLSVSAAYVARQFHISDTQVHDIFNAYVNLPRLPLPEYISVDEVFLDIGEKDRFAFVIMDFSNGEIIDIVHNRWGSTLEDYFLKIPYEERKNVKGLICDAYRTYLQLPEKYFPNACTILDSFHVVRLITTQLQVYINKVMKKYQKRDEERRNQKNHDTNQDHKKIKPSKEVILLKNYRWVLLKNRDEITYSTRRYYHKLLGMNVDTFTVEKMFLDLDKNFRKLREMKEDYIRFNDTEYENSDQIYLALNALIDKYTKSEQYIFSNFAKFLERFKTPIINSFIQVKVKRKSAREESEYYARLSNGPMESSNRKPKDLKRNSRGFSDFDYTRNRILWSTRKNTAVRGVPRHREEFKKLGKPRGKYKTK